MTSDYKAAWRERTRVWAMELLGGVCVRCGTTEDLEFDHKEASTKVVDVSAAIRDGWGRARLLEELLKCQLLCKPHNMEKSKLKGEHKGGWNKIVDPPHGTAVRYGPGKCRCERCKKWKRLYRAKLVDSQGNERAVVAQLA